MRHLLLAVVLGVALSGCTTSPTNPVPIGANTYLMSKTNVAGAFGDVGTLAEDLMVQGNAFCAKKGLKFQLIGENLRQPRVGSSLGGATIQFECVEHPGPVQLRPDNGVTTVTTGK